MSGIWVQERLGLFQVNVMKPEVPKGVEGACWKVKTFALGLKRDREKTK